MEIWSSFENRAIIFIIEFIYFRLVRSID